MAGAWLVDEGWRHLVAYDVTTMSLLTSIRSKAAKTFSSRGPTANAHTHTTCSVGGCARTNTRRWQRARKCESARRARTLHTLRHHDGAVNLAAALEIPRLEELEHLILLRAFEDERLEVCDDVVALLSI